MLPRWSVLRMSGRLVARPLHTRRWRHAHTSYTARRMGVCARNLCPVPLHSLWRPRACKRVNLDRAHAPRLRTALRRVGQTRPSAARRAAILVRSPDHLAQRLRHLLQRSATHCFLVFCSRSHVFTLMAPLDGDAHRVRFEDVWRAFMQHAPVRAWLFDRAPPSRSQAYACVTNQPEPLSFCFDGATDAMRAQAAASMASASSADSLSDFRELGTVLYHASGTALGVTFGHADRQPILPVAHQFTGDEHYRDNTVIVRRLAIRRASPQSRHLLRLQLDWFRSGVLGVDYCFIPASAPDLRPSVGFAVFGYRVFKQSEAEALFSASQAPSPEFLDGSTTLLAPRAGYISLEACDSQFQTPCMYCAYRNAVLCDCPAPIRRRVVDDAQYGPATRDLIMPYVESQIEEKDDDEYTINEMVWHYYSHRMKMSLSNGTFLTNWRYVRPTMPSLSNVVVAHIVPYSVLLSKPGSESPMIQRVLTVLGLQSNTPQLMTAVQNHEMSDDVLITDVTDLVDEIAQSADNPEEIDAVASLTPVQSNAIFFEGALLHFGADSGGSASSPGGSGDLEGGNLALQDGLADIGASRKRMRTSTRDIEAEDRKRMHIVPENGMTRGRNADGPSDTGRRSEGTEVKRTLKKETRKWQCKQCSAVIRGKRSNLTRHVQNKHTKVRPFECSLRDCDKRFQTRLNLKRHQSLVHAGRPHTCSGCARSFKTQEKLERHVATVHQPGAEPLACPLCGNCYGKRSTLSRHIAHVHKAMSDVTTDPDPDFGEKEPSATTATTSIIPNATNFVIASLADSDHKSDDLMASRESAPPSEHLLDADPWNSRPGTTPTVLNTVANSA